MEKYKNRRRKIGDPRVPSLSEKWRRAASPSASLWRPKGMRAYSCVVVFEYDIFSLMEKHGFTGKFSLIDVYLALAANNIIMGYDHTGDRLVDVGKPESVAKAEALFP